MDSRPRNLRSARENFEGVSEAIAKELHRGHTSSPFPHTHYSPVGAAPKADGSVRLILDLSSPRGDSVNDGISQEVFACTYRHTLSLRRRHKHRIALRKSCLPGQD